MRTSEVAVQSAAARLRAGRFPHPVGRCPRGSGPGSEGLGMSPDSRDQTRQARSSPCQRITSTTTLGTVGQDAAAQQRPVGRGMSHLVRRFREQPQESPQREPGPDRHDLLHQPRRCRGPCLSPQGTHELPGQPVASPSLRPTGLDSTPDGRHHLGHAGGGGQEHLYLSLAGTGQGRRTCAPPHRTHNFPGQPVALVTEADRPGFDT